MPDQARGPAGSTGRARANGREAAFADDRTSTDPGPAVGPVPEGGSRDPLENAVSRRRHVVRVLVAVTGLAWVSGCDGPMEPPPEPPPLQLVTVTPPAAELTARGMSVQLTAEVRDLNGAVMTGATVVWRSLDAAVATVDPSGLATAVDDGTAHIVASAGYASGSAVVTVMRRTASVELSPSAGTIAPGGTVQLRAEAFDANGHPVTDAALSWESGDPAVATVDETGLVTGVGPGVVTVRANAGTEWATARITVSDPQRDVLAALYEATDGPNWIRADNWMTDAPLWEWYGVYTDGSGRVRNLWIHDNNLRGRIPPELAGLTSLVSLDLSGNDLGGRIPRELGGLASLETLYLQENGLRGRIPAELGELAELKSLYLSGNDLRGRIPPQLGELAGLGWLYLDDNDLGGRIPPELGGLANLEKVYLDGNDLSGPIPPEFGALGNLEWLFLNDNDLTGPLPPELGEMSDLLILDLANNAGLAGPLPAELTNLRLWSLAVGGTGLCASSDPEFQTWLNTLTHGGGGIPICTGGARAAGMPPPGGADANEGGFAQAVPSVASHMSDGRSGMPGIEGPATSGLGYHVGR